MEDRQLVYYENDRMVEAANAAQYNNTMLMGYFNLNATDPEARKYLYAEIPYHYVNYSGTWVPRQRGGDKVLSRIYNISPRNRELFHLRVLLLNVRGATSFEHLRTVDGHVWPTFTEAAIALGLVENQRHWIACLQEAVDNAYTGKDIRFLFASILLHGLPALPRPIEMWEQFKEPMCSDFVFLNNDSQEAAFDKGLQVCVY